jgi:hypothetical protein
VATALKASITPPHRAEQADEGRAGDNRRQEDHVGLVAQRLAGDGPLDGVLRLLEPGAGIVAPALAVHGGGAPVTLDRVGEQIRVRDRARTAEGLRQVQQRALVPQVRFEGVIEPVEPFELEVLSEHDRPGHQTEHAQADHDDLVDGAASLENLDDAGGEHGRGEELRKHEYRATVGGFEARIQWKTRRRCSAPPRRARENVFAARRRRFLLGGSTLSPCFANAPSSNSPRAAAPPLRAAPLSVSTVSSTPS